LQDYAKEHKMSFNEFINTCIDYYIKNHKDWLFQFVFMWFIRYL
jgi:hypothetical protein